MFDKLLNALKSRTNWTIIVMVATNIVNAFSSLIPSEELALINSLLGALAIYFRLNPKQGF